MSPRQRVDINISFHPFTSKLFCIHRYQSQQYLIFRTGNPYKLVILPKLSISKWYTYRLESNEHIFMLLLCDISLTYRPPASASRHLISTRTRLDYTISRRTGHHDYASKIVHPPCRFE
jgi:hypothetical protein